MSWSLISYNAPFIIAGAYTLLLLYIFVRRSRQAWLLGFLAASTFWQLLRFFFRSTSDLAFIPDKAFLLSTILLGLTTAAFVGWRPRRWGLLGLGTAAVVLLLDILFPFHLNLIPFGIRIVDTVGGIALVLVWLALSASMWRLSWQQFQLSRFPRARKPNSILAINVRAGFYWGRLPFFPGSDTKYNWPTSAASGRDWSYSCCVVLSSD